MTPDLIETYLDRLLGQGAAGVLGLLVLGGFLLWRRRPDGEPSSS